MLGCALSCHCPQCQRPQRSKCHPQCRGLGAGVCPALPCPVLSLSPVPVSPSLARPGRRCGAVQVWAHAGVPEPCRIMPLMPSGAETEIPHGSQTRLFCPRNPRPQSRGVPSAGLSEGHAAALGSGVWDGLSSHPAPSWDLQLLLLGDTTPPRSVNVGRAVLVWPNPSVLLTGTSHRIAGSFSLKNTSKTIKLNH